MKTKKIICVVLVAVMAYVCACSGNEETVSQAEYDELKAQYDELSENYTNLGNDYNDLLEKYNELTTVEEETASSIDYSAITTDIFRTDITYDDLARNPDDYEGELFKMTGTIIQVIEGDGYTDYRVATSGSYDDIIIIELENQILDERLLEDDKITFYAESCNTYTYESAMGTYVTIPAAIVYIVERN